MLIWEYFRNRPNLKHLTESQKWQKFLLEKEEEQLRYQKLLVQTPQPGGGGDSVSGPPTSTNAIVQSWLNKIASDGYAYPSQTKVNIYTTAFDYADTEGLTAEMDLFGLLKVENQDLCKIPFIHSGGSLKRFDFVNTPIFTANKGLKSDSTVGGYLSANWNEVDNGIKYKKDDGCLFAASDLTTAANGNMMGNAVNTNGFRPRRTSDNLAVVRMQGLTFTGSGPANASGLMSGLVNATSRKIFRNGIEIATQGTFTTSITNSNFTVGQSSSSYFPGDILYFGVASAAIDQAKLNTFVNLLIA